MKIKYSKSAFTISEQVYLLQHKGLRVSDLNFACQFLARISYHRLFEYFLPLTIGRGHDSSFLQGTTFEQIVALYEFDKNLRGVLDDALEVIEVAFRTAMSNVMALKYSPFWFMNTGIFKNSAHHKKFMEYITELCKKADEHAIKQYFKKYNEPIYPPSWLLLENITFGNCSKLFGNIQSLRDGKEICQIFNHHPTVIDSWIRALVYMRNLCAHHARVWNRWFVILPNAVKQGNMNFNTQSIYSHLSVLDRLMQILLNNEEWKQKLYVLFNQNSFVNFEEMGFIKNWHKDDFWK